MIDVERLKTDPDYWDEVAPEGATHYCGDLFYKLDSSPVLFWCANTSWCTSESFKNGELSVDELIPRPTKTPEAEWDSTGLPPVGVECEVLDPSNGNWNKVKVTGAGDKVLLVTSKAFVATKGDEFILQKTCTFRPLKTKEQRMTEEFAQALIDDLSVLEINLDHDMATAAAIGFINRGWTKEPKS